MTHRRKEFLVYPPYYCPYGELLLPPHEPGKPWADRYRVFASKRKAFEQAVKWGQGSEVMESIHVHLQARKPWQSSRVGRSWTMEKRS